MDAGDASQDRMGTLFAEASRSRSSVRDLVARLRHAPSLSQVDAETFEINREDLKVLLQSRTEAANLIEALERIEALLLRGGR